ncbi:MAG: DUF1292 domain-containing protein [Oscillospiraceae bacterium]|nr:DUF1292 domain-containing protein [Oscillospiraceae bacterium]
MMEQFFSMVNENGEEVKYETLFTFVAPDGEREFIVYTDNGTDEDGLTNIFSAILVEDGTGMLPIESDEDLEMVQTVINSLMSEDYEEIEE